MAYSKSASPNSHKPERNASILGQCLVDVHAVVNPVNADVSSIFRPSIVFVVDALVRSWEDVRIAAVVHFSSNTYQLQVQPDESGCQHR